MAFVILGCVFWVLSSSGGADPVNVLGWWNDLDGDGLVIADASGLHRRSRDLSDPKPLAPARVAGRAIAERPGLRLVRTVASTLLLLDKQGIRAWMAAVYPT